MTDEKSPGIPTPDRGRCRNRYDTMIGKTTRSAALGPSALHSQPGLCESRACSSIALFSTRFALPRTLGRIVHWLFRAVTGFDWFFILPATCL